MDPNDPKNYILPPEIVNQTESMDTDEDSRSQEVISTVEETSNEPVEVGVHKFVHAQEKHRKLYDIHRIHCLLIFLIW